MGNYNRKDHLYRQAKEEGYRSRAAYKLIELDQKYNLLKPGLKVVDLGCAPGGWIQVAASKVGNRGLVLGVDLLPVVPFCDADFKSSSSFVSPLIIPGDITSEIVQQQIIEQAGGKIDLLLSDMSPDLTGVYFQDAARSAELVEVAFLLAETLLVQGGNVVTKIFPGSESDQLFNVVRKLFKKFSRAALKSTRKTSKEFYFVGQGYIKS